MKVALPAFRLQVIILVVSLSAIVPPPDVRAQGDRSMSLQTNPPLKALPSKAKRWALIVGVDQYRDPQIGPLRGAANDARALADALVRYAGFPTDQVILLSTDQPEERQPTRVNILRRLSNLAAVVPKDGLLLVSFAGHGMERQGQAYLLPADAQINDDVTFMEETAISVARMKERIRATGVGQVVVLLDACRNDPGGRADAPNLLTQAYTKFNFDVRNREVQAFAILYATAVGQRAYEYSEKKQGYFTWALVEGLKGNAANEKGEVTLAQLVRFVQETVPKRIGIDLGAGKVQRPFAVIEGYKAEDLVVAVGGEALPASVAAPSSAPAADSASLEMSFWETIKNSSDPADFRAYLERFPNGTFAALARRRAEPATAPRTADNTSTASGPINVEETLAQAERDYRDKDYNKVIEDSRRVLAAQPDNARANLLVGLSYLQAGKYTNAANHLAAAVTRGEKVSLPIQHHHYVFLVGDAFCAGTVAISREGFEFSSATQSGHDFIVPLTRVYKLAVEQMHGGRLRAEVGIQKEKKEDKKTYNFHLTRAYLGKRPNSSVVSAFCDDCMGEVQGLNQLIQQLIQAASSAQPGATAVGAASPQDGPASEREKVLQELLEFERQSVEAFNRGDKAALSAMMADEFTGTVDGKSYDKEKYVSALKPLKATLNLSFEGADLKLEGEKAVLSGIAAIRFQGPNGMVTTRQQFTDTFVRRGGRWLIINSTTTTLK